MPAVNGALTADGLARLYVPLANRGIAADGTRFLSAETVDQLGRVQTVPGTAYSVCGCAGGSASTTGSASAHPLPGRSGTSASGRRRLGRPGHRPSFGFVSSHIGNFTTAIGDLGILRLSGVARSRAAAVL